MESAKNQESRIELETMFVTVALSGIIKKTVAPSDIFTLVKPDMLTMNKDHSVIYACAYELFKDDKPVNLDDLYLKIKESKINRVENLIISRDITPNDLAEICSFYLGGIEEAVFHYAIKVREEHIKKVTEGKLIGLVSDCQQYLRPLEDISQGLKQVQSIVDGGTPVDASMESIIDSYITMLEQGSFAKPTSLPWNNLNTVLRGGICPGELAVLAARPGMGKTAMAGCIAIDAAKNDIPVLMITREVPINTLLNRFISREKNLDLSLFREFAEMTENVKEAIIDGANRFRNLPLTLIEKTTSPMTVSEIRRNAKQIKGLGFIVIDYLQLLCPEKNLQSREREIAEMSRALKQLSLDCECPVLLLSQLNRSVEQTAREPNLSDLRESGAIEQDADIVIFLHTKKEWALEKTMPLKAIVAKGRSSGTGTAALLFNKTFADFKEDNDYNRWKKETKQDLYNEV